MLLNEGNQTHNGAHRPQLVYRKRCTGKGGAGGLARQNGPAQWAEYGKQSEVHQSPEFTDAIGSS